MSFRKSFIKENTSKKILWQRRILLILFIVLSGFVLYDSVIHKTPLYYIGFYFLGKLVGLIYKRLYTVEYQKKERIFSFSSNSWNIIFTVLLISTKFFFGEKMLHSLEVIWAADALYLFSLGIYYSKWKSIAQQIDEMIYKQVSKNSKSNKL